MIGTLKRVSRKPGGEMLIPHEKFHTSLKGRRNVPCGSIVLILSEEGYYAQCLTVVGMGWLYEPSLEDF